MSIFSILSTASSGLRANQTAMSVISNNVANVSTKGYSRQRVNLVASGSYNATAFNGQLGTGVTIEGVSRIVDQFLETRIQREQGNADSWAIQTELLEGIELGINSLDLPTRLNEFWNAWHNLSINPTMKSSVYEIQQQGKTLIVAMQSAGRLLTDMENEIDDTISNQITQANNISEQIAKLNTEIRRSVKMEQNPNTFLDQRDVLIRELAGITGASVTYHDDATVSVTMNVADALGEPQQLSMVDGMNFEMIPDGVNVKSTNGSLYGLQKIRDNELQDFKIGLDELSVSLVTEVNKLHNPTADPAKINFFNPGVTGVANLALSNEVKEDETKIGTNTTSIEEKGALGTNVYNLGTKFAKDISAYLENLGTIVKVAETQNDYEEGMMAELENLRASVSGVSLDEEMTNMFMYQRAYQASAKLLSVIDEMLQVIINMV